jgi:hypothetical protein
MILCLIQIFLIFAALRGYHSLGSLATY